MFYSMSRTFLYVILTVSVLLASGCAHKYSETQYSAVVKQSSDCSEKTQKLQDEADNARKSAEQIQKKLDMTSQELATALLQKQELLDNSIQCLEEKKILIKQISQSSTVSQEKKDAQQRLARDYDLVMSRLEPERLSDQVYIVKTQEKIKIVIPQKSLFPTPGSAWLTPKGTKLVKKVGAVIKGLTPSTIEVAGHTDNSYAMDPKTSAYPSNWHLALARALSVLQTMEELHVKRDTMFASSYGDTRPIADTATEAGKAMNRRVEIVFAP
jgi:chemotaxis protein MotB